MKKPKLEKTPKAEKPKPKIVNLGDNSLDPQLRELFLSDLSKWKRLDKAAKDAAAERRAHEKVLKEDGFLLTQVKFVVACQEDGGAGEAIVKAKISNNLLAARYAGLAIGTQLDMWLEPDRQPAVERAYDEGVQASMEGKSAKPPYDPSTPQAQEWLRGFNDNTALRIKDGIKPLVSEMN